MVEKKELPSPPPNENCVFCQSWWVELSSLRVTLWHVISPLSPPCFSPQMLGSQLEEHKIQSRNGPLELSLHRVPKMMGRLTKVWAPEATVVSFKLETDERILIEKVGD